MNYGELPVLVLFLAAAYLLTVYVLLSLARKATKVTTKPPSDVGQPSSVR